MDIAAPCSSHAPGNAANSGTSWGGSTAGGNGAAGKGARGVS